MRAETLLIILLIVDVIVHKWRIYTLKEEIKELKRKENAPSSENFLTP